MFWINPSLQLVQGDESNGAEGLREVLERERHVFFLVGPHNFSLDSGSCPENAVAPLVQPSFYRRGDRGPSRSDPPEARRPVFPIGVYSRQQARLYLKSRSVLTANIWGRYFRPSILFYFYDNITFHFLKPCPLSPSRSILGIFPFIFPDDMAVSGPQAASGTHGARELLLLSSPCFPPLLLPFSPLILAFSSTSRFFSPFPSHFFLFLFLIVTLRICFH